MIRAILYGLSVYIVLMIIVSSISTLVSPNPEEPHLVIIGESESDETPTEQTEIHDAELSETTESPFDFSVNVITESEEETAVEYPSIIPIHRTMPHDVTAVVTDELEKRKRYFIYLCKRLYCRLHSLKEEV